MILVMVALDEKAENFRYDRSRTPEKTLLTRIERLTELPLLILAFVMIPLIAGPYLWDLSIEEEATFMTLDMFIWAIFAVDLII